MSQKLNAALQIHRLAADLGLRTSSDPVKAVRQYARRRLLDFLGEYPTKTLADFLMIAADRLGTRFIEVRSDEDVARVTAEYTSRRELGFALLEEELCDDVFAITIKLLAPQPWERHFVSVIDCRGPKAYRSYYSKWHELAHLLTLTPQSRLKFRRTHIAEEENDPEERLMELIAGDGGFLPELIAPYTIEPISFAVISRIRNLLCPEASDQASRIGIVNSWPTPCISVHARMALKKTQRQALEQGCFGFVSPPKPALRAVDVTINAAARAADILIPRNMRIPNESVIYRVLAENLDELEAQEDLQWWASGGRCLAPCAVRVVALRAWDQVNALIIPVED